MKSEAVRLWKVLFTAKRNLEVTQLLSAVKRQNRCPHPAGLAGLLLAADLVYGSAALRSRVDGSQLITLLLLLLLHGDA